MFDVRRLRPTCLVLSCVVLALLGCRLVQWTTIRHWPTWLPKSDWTFSTIVSYERVGSRVSGVLRQDIAPGTRFAATLGSSTLEASVDPKTWDAAAPPLRWVHLSGHAVGANGLLGMGEIVLRSRLKPEALVVGLDLGMLAQPEDYIDVFMSDDDQLDPSKLVAHIKARQFRIIKDDVEHLLVAPLNRVFANRNRVGTAARYLSLEARLAVFGALGVPSDLLFPPDPQPWDVVPKYISGDRPSQESLDTQHAAFGRRGWYNPGNYSTSRPGIVSLVRLIRRSREAGVPILLVLLPEKEAIRAEVPPEADRCLKAALEENFGGNEPPVLDLRDSVPDDLFYDVVHVNPVGSLVISRRIAQELSTRLGSLISH